MAAHPVGDNRQSDTLFFRMGQERDAVLLFLAVALMLGDACIYDYWHYY
jgi:hypothetical protein